MLTTLCCFLLQYQKCFINSEKLSVQKVKLWFTRWEHSFGLYLLMLFYPPWVTSLMYFYSPVTPDIPFLFFRIISSSNILKTGIFSVLQQPCHPWHPILILPYNFQLQHFENWHSECISTALSPLTSHSYSSRLLYNFRLQHFEDWHFQCIAGLFRCFHNPLNSQSHESWTTSFAAIASLHKRSFRIICIHMNDENWNTSVYNYCLIRRTYDYKAFIIHRSITFCDSQDSECESLWMVAYLDRTRHSDHTEWQTWGYVVLVEQKTAENIDQN